MQYIVTDLIAKNTATAADRFELEEVLTSWFCTDEEGVEEAIADLVRATVNGEYTAASAFLGVKVERVED